MQRRRTILIGIGLGLALLAGGAAPVTQDAAWVAQRVQKWQPTTQERAWEQIGWATNLSEALRLGKQHRRPIFLFTLDGRMQLGRC